MEVQPVRPENAENSPERLESTTTTPHRESSFKTTGKQPRTPRSSYPDRFQAASPLYTAGTPSGQSWVRHPPLQRSILSNQLESSSPTYTGKSMPRRGRVSDRCRRLGRPEMAGKVGSGCPVRVGSAEKLRFSRGRGERRKGKKWILKK